MPKKKKKPKKGKGDHFGLGDQKRALVKNRLIEIAK
jgi:hypothetical protein